MSARFVFKLPDLGEGIVEAEIVEWFVAAGDVVTEDQPLVEIMTDKANVEIPSPVAGTVVEINGAPGDRMAVGSELVVLETDQPLPETPTNAPEADTAAASAPAATTPQASRARVLASPAVRHRAREVGVELDEVTGSGPAGRIRSEDLEAHVAAGRSGPRRAQDRIEEVRVTGVRRVIAERVAASKREIPHFSYIESVDVTELEALRVHLNGSREQRLSLLPFIVMALVRSLEDSPECNATYDAERNLILRNSAVHVGIATHTDDGLKVPVVRHAEGRSLDDLAAEIDRLARAVRDKTAGREELVGSTITVTSLGALGGVASTPVINPPELAIVGVNRAAEQPAVVGGAVVVRRLMNLSSSFDHRFIDGFVAAGLIQRVKAYLEHPATLFMR